MAIVKQNNAEGGTNGVSVTTGNSGGASGNAWDAVVEGANHLIFFNTPWDGALCYYVPQQPGVGYCEWTLSTAEIWGRMWAFFDPRNGADNETPFIYYLDASNNDLASLSFNFNSGKFRIAARAGGGQVLTTGATSTTNQWVRVDWHFKISATVGVAEARIYFDPTGAPTTFETITSSATDTGSAAAKVRIGLLTVPSYNRHIVFDTVSIDDANWVGTALPQQRIFVPTGAVNRASSW